MLRNRKDLVGLLVAETEGEEEAVVDFAMLIAEFEVPVAADHGGEVDFVFEVVGLVLAVPAKAGLHLEAPVGVEAVEEMAEEGAASVGEKGVLELGFRAEGVEHEIIVVGLSPITRAAREKIDA